MFKYRFVCEDKDDIIYRLNQKMFVDLPCGRSLWGWKLYGEGIHFTQVGDVVKGFFLENSECERVASQIRTIFSGRFVNEGDNVYFDVYIYPRIIEFLFLTGAMISISANGIFMALIAFAIYAFFLKGYYNMIVGTYEFFERLFNR
ncbi:MAG: hypothetical protein IKM22_00790 [Clostridia bacterium]|nr:hypothetical protein [Clostridia bacterium]